MTNIYHHVYYQYYRWSIKINGKDDYPQYVALIMIALMSYINVVTVLFAIDMIVMVPGFSAVLSRWGVVTSMAMLGSLHYYFLIHGEKYEDIIIRFGSEKDNSSGGSALDWVYTSGSIGVLFALVFLQAWMNKGDVMN